jgi:transposase
MKVKNRYRKWARLDNLTTRKIIEYFSMDFTARMTSEILWIERKTINNWYNYIREKIYENCEKEKQEKLWWWIYELDESYFWPTRIKWKRWRWAWWKTIVFWLLKRWWKVYTEIIPDAKAKSLIPIIRGKIDDWSEINTDWWKAYDWLVDLWYEKHFRVHHWENEFARWKQHINWIESFWSFTKRRLRKFNWVKKEFFHLHLKESEFRYNIVKSWWKLNYIIQHILSNKSI